MIATMNSSIKISAKSSKNVPINNLCLSVLRTLRECGYIWGFRFTSHMKKFKLYPTVEIFYKYIDRNSGAFAKITTRNLNQRPKIGSRKFLISYEDGCLRINTKKTKTGRVLLAIN
jgi:ribosomal protein S8